MLRTAYLILENGKKFKGKVFGASFNVTGEIVFTTAMTGYIETLTDPGYYGQIVVQTFPSIGNYGIIPSDFESSSAHLKAYIVKEKCQTPSNFRCESAIDAFLLEHNIVGLYDVDTRSLTKAIRDGGIMNARIIVDGDEDISDLKDYRITKAVDAVTRKEPEEFKCENADKMVAVVDFGVKKSYINELLCRKCNVIVLPAHISCEEILKLNPNGVVLSNGPGDPAENIDIITEIAKLYRSKIPIMGINLGHQMLALATGAKTYKLKHGHRGANFPVRDIETGRIFITNQSHNYVVDNKTIYKNASISFENVYDKSCEGIVYNDAPAFSVQFNPQTPCGAKDISSLFDEFIKMMEEA